MDGKFEYRVIGWTSCLDKRFPNFNRSREAYEAILKEIRENGYKFGGETHEDCAPVFNDGTAARFSGREWDGVMAEAWQSENIKDGEIKLPESGVDFLKIEKPVHEFAVYDRKYIDDGYICEKSLFIEVATDELKKIKKGDFIDFTDGDYGGSLIGKAFVVNVYSAATVEEMVNKMERALPAWKDLSDELGFERELSKEHLIELLEKKLSPDKVREHGLWGIEVYYP